MDVLRQKRLAFIFFVFWLCLFGLVARLWLIQIKEGHFYNCLALEQGSHWVSLEDAPRGKILDRNMIPVSGEKVEDRVVVFPEAVVDKAEVVRGLAEVLEEELPGIKHYLEGGACSLPYLVTPEQSAAIRNKGWAGVMVLPVHFRYGDRPLTTQVVGHLGKISSTGEFLSLSGGKKIYHYGDLVGKAGLEGFYEQDLKGSSPQKAVRVFTDAKGRLLGGPRFEVEDQEDEGDKQDLLLTIDSRIQQLVEDVMDRSVGKGAVVVMEAGTGDILAMASRPGFNPAHPEQALSDVEGERFLDRCTALYQPGSVFKIVVAAAALEEGAVGLFSKFTCRGEKEDLISCWNDAGHGDIDFARAFAESCNPVFAKTGLNLGAEKIIEYARRFGFDNQTVIGYPVPSDSRQDLNLIGAPYNLVNSSVGQGPVLVTPVQVASMINTVASGGVYREPRLVREVRNGGKTTREFTPGQGTKAISQNTASRLCQLMDLVVDQGTGREAQSPAFKSSGKTGSAQTGNGKGQVNAWFAGYAPRYSPRYIVVVLIEDGIGGSQSATAVFREIIEQVL